jgi:nucleoside-diphosphate-sugar epimerase
MLVVENGRHNTHEAGVMLERHTKDEKAGRVAAYYEGKNVLVTGGFGFVGGHAVKALVELKANVTVFDIRSDPSVDSMLNDESLELRPRVKVVKGDLASPADVRTVINDGNFDFIFNFAAYATVIEKAVENPFDTIMANTLGLVNVMEAARAQKTQPLVFHASTDKVYGEMEGESYEEDKTPLRGIGVYDGAKLAADVFARTYNDVFGLPTVVLRMCNIFGPYDYNIGYRLIPKAMRNLFAGDHPTAPELYFDSIDHWRDYLYVDDCIRAILLLGFHGGCRGDVFNLNAAQYISTPELMKSIVTAAYEVEKEIDEARAEAILTNGIVVKVRPHAPNVVAITKQHLNGDKITRVTEFEPAIDFTDGLKRTVRAYRAHFRGPTKR